MTAYARARARARGNPLQSSALLLELAQNNYQGDILHKDFDHYNLKNFTVVPFFVRVT